MSNSGHRLYHEIGTELKNWLRRGVYKVGDRLPPERTIAELFSVSRTIIREAFILLEIENLVKVKKGSGVYVVAFPEQESTVTLLPNPKEDVGPFELLQARQLIESQIAFFAASQILKSDILQLRDILEQEKETVQKGDIKNYCGDECFHITLAKATKNGVLQSLQEQLWHKRRTSKMWQQLHTRIEDHSYRLQSLEDHHTILRALQMKNPICARRAMWQHLENVKQVLLEVSDSDDPNFDGYLFDSVPALLSNTE